jgi:N-formylglutamate amidohydrolase
VEQQFRVSGYKTARNSPYAGGPIVKHYGEMSGVESLQIEIRYHVYLKESQLDKPEPPKADVPELQAAQKSIREVFGSIIRCVHDRN